MPQKQIVNVEALMHSTFKNLAADRQVACKAGAAAGYGREKTHLHLPSLLPTLKFLRHGEPFGTALA